MIPKSSYAFGTNLHHMFPWVHCNCYNIRNRSDIWISHLQRGLIFHQWRKLMIHVNYRAYWLAIWNTLQTIVYFTSNVSSIQWWLPSFILESEVPFGINILQGLCYYGLCSQSLLSCACLAVFSHMQLIFQLFNRDHDIPSMSFQKEWFNRRFSTGSKSPKIPNQHVNHLQLPGSPKRISVCFVVFLLVVFMFKIPPSLPSIGIAPAWRCCPGAGHNRVLRGAKGPWVSSHIAMLF